MFLLEAHRGMVARVDIVSDKNVLDFDRNFAFDCVSDFVILLQSTIMHFVYCRAFI